MSVLLAAGMWIRFNFPVHTLTSPNASPSAQQATKLLVMLVSHSVVKLCHNFWLWFFCIVAGLRLMVKVVCAKVLYTRACKTDLYTGTNTAQ